MSVKIIKCLGCTSDSAIIHRTPDVRERSIFLYSCVASRIRGPWFMSDRVISDFLCSQGMLQVWCNRRQSIILLLSILLMIAENDYSSLQM